MVRLDNPHNLRIVYRYRSFCYALSLSNTPILPVIQLNILLRAVVFAMIVYVADWNEKDYGLMYTVTSIWVIFAEVLIQLSR